MCATYQLSFDDLNGIPLLLQALDDASYTIIIPFLNLVTDVQVLAASLALIEI